MDLLDALRRNQLTCDDADRLRDAAIDASHEDDDEDEWWQRLELSHHELTAHNWGASWHDLAVLRYEGWPDRCSACGLPLDYRTDGWAFTHAPDGTPGLEHVG